MRIFLHLLIPLIILGLGIGAYYNMKDPKKLEKIGITKKKPGGSGGKGRPSGAGRPTGPPKIRTEVVSLVKEDHTVLLQSQGEVRTHNATTN